MNSELDELRANITTLMAEYRAERRGPDNRLRPGPRAAELRVAIQELTGELEFLQQTQKLLSVSTAASSFRSARLPANMPRFKRPLSGAHSSVQDYIARFERALRADSYPLDKFTLALAACCEAEEAEWVESNLIILPWDEAKDSFLRHFISNDMDTLYSFELEGIYMNPKESVSAFADRYLYAMRLAHEDPTASRVRVAHFLTRLPETVRKDLHMVKIAKPEEVESVSAIVHTLVALYPTTKPGLKSPTTEKWCSHHKSNTHSTAECIAKSQNVKPSSTRANLFSKESSASTKWCSFHQSKSHSTSECRAKPNASSNLQSSVHFAAQPSRATQPPLLCHKCGKEGHYANRCTSQSRVSQPNAATQARHISTADPPEEHAGSQDISTSQDPSDCHSHSHSVQDYEEIFGQSPSRHSASVAVTANRIDYQSAFIVPITIDNHELMAYVDSGASHSSVPNALVNEFYSHQIIPPKPDSKVSLGAKGVFTPRLGSVDLAFTWNTKQYQHTFEIAEPPEGIEVIIGRDLFTKLGVTISGLPLPVPLDSPGLDVLGDSTPDLIVSSDCKEPHPLSANTSLQQAIARNQSINPNSFCTVPEAVVHLDTGDHSPVYRRQYPIPVKLQAATDAQIKEWLLHGKVTDAPLGCRYNNPLLVVPKKDTDGNWTKARICIDPRLLNQQLTPDRFPLPLVKDVFAFFTNCQLFSVVDLEQAYLQLPIHPEHRQKTAFTWRNRHLMFVGTPFGIRNTASILQRTMSILFRFSTCAYPFQDDIPVGSLSAESHLRDIINTIDVLSGANLRIRLSKCCFFQTKLNLLGHTISNKGIAIDNRKLSAVSDWPLPSTGKQIEQYLGLINYFRDFIPNYATVAAPLECLRKQASLPRDSWTTAQLDSFIALKNILKQAPFLSFPDFSAQFIIATDASNAGIGAVLYQLQRNDQPDSILNRKWIMFTARALSPSERNYSATKRELLAIIHALLKFHYYIWGEHFILYTDHRALTYMFTQQNLSPMLTNWLDTLLSYSFTIHHRPGIENILPDALSRVFPSRKALFVASQAVTAHSTEVQPVSALPEAQRSPAIELAHLKGHFGVKATMRALISEGKVWPSMRVDIEAHIQSCPACRRWTIVQSGYHPLTPISASDPMDVIAIDTAHSFPTTPRGNNVLLVVICVFTRFVFLRALPDNSAISVASALFGIFLDFGFPRIIQSDNGTEFVNSVVKHLTSSFGIDHRLSTPYHPRANGLAERTVQTACRAIRKLLEGEGHSWDIHHHVVQLWINSKIAEFHSSTPFSVMFGRRNNPLSDFSAADQFTSPDATALRSRVTEFTDVIFPGIRNISAVSRAKAVQAFTRKHSKRINKDPFPQGSHVMVLDPVRSSKSEPFYLGPFRVLRRNQGGAYQLLDSDNSLFPRNVAPSQMKLTRVNPVDDEASYVVDKVLNHKGSPSKRSYLVKWKHFDDSFNSWIPATNFDDLAIVEKYWATKTP